MRHRYMSASVLALSLLQAGCYGQFALTRTVHRWNGRATDNRFVNSLLTWAMIIVPVYPLATVADFLIFNTVEFWSGKNPVALEETSRGAKLTYEGHQYLYRPDGENRLIVERDGVEVAHLERDATGSRVRVERPDGQLVSEVNAPPAGVSYARASGAPVY